MTAPWAIPVTVELYYSSAWQDITTDVYTRDPITITRGRSSETQRTAPGTLSLSLRNDGAHKYSTRYPSSALYGLIGRNTPIRVSVDGDYRFWGEVESWPQRWSTDGVDVWVPITANGILKRITAAGSRAPAKSAIRRSITAANAPTPLVYLPLEDGQDSVEVMSGIDGPAAPVNAASVVFAGAPPLHFGGPAGLLGYSSSGADSNGPGDVQPVIPAHAATNDYVIGFFHRWMFEEARNSPYPDEQKRIDPDITIVDPADSVPQARLSHRIGFAGIQWQARIESRATEDGDSIIRLLGASSEEDVVWTIDRSENIDIGWHEIQFRFHQNGANIEIQLYLDGVLREGVYFNSGVPQIATTTPIVTDTLGALTDVLPGRRADWQDPLIPAPPNFWAPYGIMHLYVYTDDAVGQWWDAGTGYNGETVTDRLERLCAEQGVSIVTSGADPTQLGPQPVGIFPDLLHVSAEADGGILSESRTAFGLEFLTRAAMQDLAAAITLDYDAKDVAPPLDPIEDTAHVENDVTVTRIGGGYTRAVQTVGPLNVSEPADDPTGVGRVEARPELNLYEDAQTAPVARWRLHRGTWDEPRYPKVPVDVAALEAAGKTSLVAAAGVLDIGDRLVIENPPDWLGPADIDQLAQGYTEVIESHRWKITPNTVPYGPYKPEITNLATDPAATVNGYGVGEIGWSPLWFGDGGGAGATTLLTDQTDGPLPWVSTYMRKTWTVAPSNNGDTGYANSQGWMDANTNGFAWAETEVRTVSAYLRPSAAIEARVTVQWHNSAGTIIATDHGPTENLTADEWFRLSHTFTAPAGAETATIAVNPTSGGTTWNIADTLDGTAIMVTDGSTLYQYRDGDFPTWTWDGTAHDSQSTGWPVPA